MFTSLLVQLSVMMGHTAVLGGLVSLQTLQDALAYWGYPAVVLFIMIESSGIPFPGETMLLFASFTAGLPGSHLSIVGVIIAAALGAIIGDNLGYLVGRYGGRPFALRFGKYIFLREHHLDAAEQFFIRHGDKTVFFGRFIAVLRAWAAFLAGVNKMPWPKFLAYNAAGGICWATLMGLLGFYCGHFLGDFSRIDSIGKALGFIGLAIVVGPVIFYIVRHRLKARKARKAAEEALAAAHEEPEEATPVK
ncbi:MAG TPA: DedA family protein [Ktedonobacterales bacterium]|nr:DedA family protein [Ktedonobacterales bacterium]